MAWRHKFAVYWTLNVADSGLTQKNCFHFPILVFYAFDYVNHPYQWKRKGPIINCSKEEAFRPIPSWNTSQGHATHRVRLQFMGILIPNTLLGLRKRIKNSSTVSNNTHIRTYLCLFPNLTLKLKTLSDNVPYELSRYCIGLFQW